MDESGVDVQVLSLTTPDTQNLDHSDAGGAIWRVSSALHDETELDSTSARYVNTKLADYLVPVNADIPVIDIIIVPEKDSTANPLGIKGIGEIGIVGMNDAIANAVFHATGKRIRSLPIRSEKLL